MAQYEVTPGIPLPSNHVRRVYPFDTMSVGDSFFVEDSSPRPKVLTAASNHGRRTGSRFTTRRVVENGLNGFRVWRIA